MASSLSLPRIAKVPWLSQAKSLRNKPYPCHFRGRLVTVVTGSGLLVPRPVATLGTAGRNRHRRNKGVSSSVATLGTAGWNRHRCNKGVSSSVATLGATGWNRHRCNKTASVPIATLGAAGRNRHRCNKTASVSIATLGATGRNRHRRNHRLLALQRRMEVARAAEAPMAQIPRTRDLTASFMTVVLLNQSCTALGSVVVETPGYSEHYIW